MGMTAINPTPQHEVLHEALVRAINDAAEAKEWTVLAGAAEWALQSINLNDRFFVARPRLRLAIKQARRAAAYAWQARWWKDLG